MNYDNYKSYIKFKTLIQDHNLRISPLEFLKIIAEINIPIFYFSGSSSWEPLSIQRILTTIHRESSTVANSDLINFDIFADEKDIPVGLLGIHKRDLKKITSIFPSLQKKMDCVPEILPVDSFRSKGKQGHQWQLKRDENSKIMINKLVGILEDSANGRDISPFIKNLNGQKKFNQSAFVQFIEDHSEILFKKGKNNRTSRGHSMGTISDFLSEALKSGNTVE